MQKQDVCRARALLGHGGEAQVGWEVPGLQGSTLVDLRDRVHLAPNRDRGRFCRGLPQEKKRKSDEEDLTRRRSTA